VGPDGVVRVGCSAYTTSDEIDRVVREVARIAG
jgi:selenocysteine lyase/cysteine desulfurase